MKRAQRNKIKKANPTLKTSIDEQSATKMKQYAKTKQWRFARNFITTLSVLTVSAFVALGTTACFVESNQPNEPVNPNPPIINPTPENPTPENPTPENPTPENPTPENPTPENPTPENPEKPDPEQPTIDYDKLTPENMTAEQKATIVNNVTTALKNNIQRNILNSGVVNKVIAMDFQDNYVTLLLDYTNNTLGNMYGLYKYEMNSEMSYKNLLTTNIAPTSSSSKGEVLFSFSTTTNDNRVEEVMAKLNPSIDVEKCDFTSIINTGGAIISGIGATHEITVYTINNNGITRTVSNAKSDANYTDPIGQGIINGSLGTTYTAPQVETYDLSEKALYSFDGLEKEVAETKSTSTYKVMVGNKTIGTIKNGKYYYEEQE